MTRAGDARRRTIAAVREIGLRLTTEDAHAIRRAGDDRAAAIIAQARTEAAFVIEQRCAAARRLAEFESRDHLAEARARARGTVLRAQRSALTDVRASAHAMVRDLIDDPRLGQLLERLAADAHQRLAPAGQVEIAPTPDGGFVARAGTREIDCSLRAQVDRVLDAMAGDLERLWQ